MPRNEVGMKMGLKNVGDIHAHGTGFGDVDIDIPPGINHSAIILAGEKVGAVSNFADEKMFEQHEMPPFYR